MLRTKISISAKTIAVMAMALLLVFMPGALTAAIENTQDSFVEASRQATSCSCSCSCVSHANNTTRLYRYGAAAATSDPPTGKFHTQTSRVSGADSAPTVVATVTTNNDTKSNKRVYSTSNSTSTHVALYDALPVYFALDSGGPLFWHQSQISLLDDPTARARANAFVYFSVPRFFALHEAHTRHVPSTHAKTMTITLMEKVWEPLDAPSGVDAIEANVTFYHASASQSPNKAKPPLSKFDNADGNMVWIPADHSSSAFYVSKAVAVNKSIHDPNFVAFSDHNKAVTTELFFRAKEAANAKADAAGKELIVYNFRSNNVCANTTGSPLATPVTLQRPILESSSNAPRTTTPEEFVIAIGSQLHRAVDFLAGKVIVLPHICIWLLQLLLLAGIGLARMATDSFESVFCCLALVFVVGTFRFISVLDAQTAEEIRRFQAQEREREEQQRREHEERQSREQDEEENSSTGPWQFVPKVWTSKRINDENLTPVDVEIIATFYALDHAAPILHPLELLVCLLPRFLPTADAPLWHPYFSKIRPIEYESLLIAETRVIDPSKLKSALKRTKSFLHSDKWQHEGLNEAQTALMRVIWLILMDAEHEFETNSIILKYAWRRDDVATPAAASPDGVSSTDPAAGAGAAGDHIGSAKDMGPHAASNGEGSDDKNVSFASATRNTDEVSSDEQVAAATLNDSVTQQTEEDFDLD
ncbi:hypothetical protein MPSEU_000152400 [Mayamaea pseudoterrestris]|nr:hypothetical protein MPSEU_000152400 [Mayamaea pseudoterrestris]